MTRLRYDGLSTTLGADLTGTSISFATPLTHAGGTAVPTIGAGNYIPLSIMTSAGRLAEIVYLTAYTAGATTGTVIRGQEGTSSATRAATARVVHAPTVTDVAGVESGRVAGTGSPEGVVAAPVGAEYVDLAGTNGAIKWIKRFGTGDTGWRVTYGDTGLRSIAGNLASGVTAGAVTLRRQGNVCTLRLATIGTLTPFTTILSTGPGFLAGQTYAFLRDDVETGQFGVFQLLDYDLFYFNPVAPGVTFAPTSRFGGTITWQTDDQWPAVLPGVPG